MNQRPVLLLFAITILPIATACGNNGTKPISTASPSASVISSTIPTGTPAVSSSPTASGAATQASSCADQIAAWKNSGVSGQLNAVISDLQNFSASTAALANDLSSGLDPSSDESSLQTASASLQADVQALQSNLPPVCVPHMRQDMSAGLTYFSTAAIEAGQGVTEVSSGNYNVADGDLVAASTAISKGSSKIEAATADAQAFSNSEG